MVFKELLLENKKQINEFLNRNNGHILQSYEWGDLRLKEGHIVKRYALVSEVDEIKVYCQLVFHKLPKWYPSKSKYVGEVWRGPVVSDEINHSELVEFLGKLKEVSRELNPVFIKFEPKIIETSKLKNPFSDVCVRGEETFIPCTANLNLDRTLDEIQSAFDKYTRKNIRKAEKKGVTVKIFDSRQHQLDAIKRAYGLLRGTSQRAGFRIRGQKFYEDLVDIQDEYVKMYVVEASVEGKIAASYITLTMGNTIYTPYSGSDRSMSEFKANDIINWELIKLAKTLGLKKYDQWGVLPLDAPLNNSMWGVTNFKMGFGGERERYIGAYDLVLCPKDYKLFSFAWRVRKMLKK